MLMSYFAVYSYSSTLSNWESSELLVLAKHHATFGKDKVVGVAIACCSALNDQLTLSLGASCSVTDMGQAILNVLSSRAYDEFAKEFVTLKTSQRWVASEEVEDGGDPPGSGARRSSSVATGTKKGGWLK